MGPTNPDIWDQEIPVPAMTIQDVDAAIAKKLPQGTKPIWIEQSGASYWARTAKITTIDANGDKDAFFVKVHQGHVGKEMVLSEFSSMTTLHEVIPKMVAQPMGWGTYGNMDDTHFVLCKYHKFREETIPGKSKDHLPDKAEFKALVAELHRHISPDGKFGNPTATFGGRNPQLFPVSDTWEECFRKGVEAIFAAEKKTHGQDKELEYLEQAMLERVFPRLIRALEEDGRKIVPCLVHGDLWEGNTAVDAETGKPMIFDATPLYAHHEYELGPWLPARHDFGPYIEEYTKYYPASEPKGEFNDRLVMYCLRFDMHASSLYPGNLTFRNLSKDAMRMLSERYGK